MERGQVTALSHWDGRGPKTRSLLFGNWLGTSFTGTLGPPVFPFDLDTHFRSFLPLPYSVVWNRKPSQRPTRFFFPFPPLSTYVHLSTFVHLSTYARQLYSPFIYLCLPNSSS